MRYKFVFLAILIFANLLFSQNSSQLDELIDLALQNNPDYQSAVARARAMEAAIKPAGTLPDPKLGLAVANLPTNSFVFNQEPMTGKKISFMQAIPFPGKMGLKSDIAKYSYLQMQYQTEELKNSLIRMVKKSYYQLYLIDRSIETVEKNRQLLQEMKNIAETKYSVGGGLQQDVLKAHVELSKLSDKLIQLRRKREQIVFQLNKILNRALETKIERVELPDISVPYDKIDSLIVLARKNRPLLLAWAQAIEAAKSAESLAKLNYLPDFAIGVAYTQRDDLANGAKMHDFLSAELSLSLPLYFFRKQNLIVQKQQLNTISFEDKFQAVRNDVDFQIRDALSEAKKFEDLVLLYQDGIIPQAQQSFSSALTGYQVDKVDFLTLFNNQMTLFNYELDFFRVQTERMKSVADLEFALGATLSK